MFFFFRKNVTVVLRLALLVFHMATALIENVRKTSESEVMLDKHWRQTLTMALFNLCYVFYVVFVKRIKWCIVPYIIERMTSVYSIRWSFSFPQNKTCLRDWLRNMNRAQWKPTCHSKLCRWHFEVRMLVISRSIASEKLGSSHHADIWVQFNSGNDGQFQYWNYLFKIMELIHLLFATFWEIHRTKSIYKFL